MSIVALGFLAREINFTNLRPSAFLLRQNFFSVQLLLVVMNLFKLFFLSLSAEFICKVSCHLKGLLSVGQKGKKEKKGE